MNFGLFNISHIFDRTIEVSYFKVGALKILFLPKTFKSFQLPQLSKIKATTLLQFVTLQYIKKF